MTPSIACWINVFDLVGDDFTVVTEFEVAWVYKDSKKLDYRSKSQDSF
jgi:hypothetical protein